jgi:hypothetical protein
LLAGCGNQTPATGEVLTFITKSLSVAYTDESYSEEIRLSSGTRPYSVRVARGGLPPGLTLQNRTITGVVKADLKDAQSRVFEFTLEASDANLSVKSQDFRLEVRRLPGSSVEWQPAPTEVKTETRVPLVLRVPKRTASMRLFIPIPEGFAFKALEPGAGRPIFVYQLKDRVLRVDAAFTERFTTIRDQTVLYLRLTVDGSRRLSGKVGFELRAGGKIVSSAKLETGAPASTPAPPPAPIPPAPGTPPAPTPPNPPAPPAPTTPPGTP